MVTLYCPAVPDECPGDGGRVCFDDFLVELAGFEQGHLFRAEQFASHLTCLGGCCGSNLPAQVTRHPGHSVMLHDCFDGRAVSCALLVLVGDLVGGLDPGFPIGVDVFPFHPLRPALAVFVHRVASSSHLLSVMPSADRASANAQRLSRHVSHMPSMFGLSQPRHRRVFCWLGCIITSPKLEAGGRTPCAMQCEGGGRSLAAKTRRPIAGPPTAFPRSRRESKASQHRRFWASPHCGIA